MSPQPSDENFPSGNVWRPSMTTPGRQAAIEAAAKALYEHGQQRTALRPFERCSESTKAVYRNEAIAAIDAYERALAEQPREER